MLWIIVIGFFVGVVAKFLMPGPRPGGIVVTALLGIGGATLADSVGNSFGYYQHGEFYSFFSAVIGAMVILFIYAALTVQKRNQ